MLRGPSKFDNSTVDKSRASNLLNNLFKDITSNVLHSLVNGDWFIFDDASAVVFFLVGW